MNIEKITDFSQLSGDQRELAETVGLEAYRSLIENFGGCQIYIPKLETALKKFRNAEIRKKFNGENYCELAKKYNLSEIMIRKITKK